MIGYDLSKATDGSSDPGKVAGKVLLLDNAVQSPGILFAFSVLVDNTSPFTLQLYHFEGQTYRLGQEFTITPSVQQGREDVRRYSAVCHCMKILRTATSFTHLTFSSRPLIFQ